jgi:hypothetical protein
MKYLAIYNKQKKLVEFEETVDETEILPLMAFVKGKDTKIGEVLLIDQRRTALTNECIGRGTLEGEWRLYEAKFAFSWNDPQVSGNAVSSNE